MRLTFPCPHCYGPAFEGRPSICFSLVSPNRSYQLQCQNGHISSFILANWQHEILFEIGTSALADGYYREAVSAYAAALERFYECVFRLACRRFSITVEDRDRTWKPMKNDSQRQFGAYLCSHLLMFSRTPPHLTQEQMAFRNRVIHQGLIPTREDAIHFGEAVIKVVSPQLLDLIAQHEEFWIAEFEEHLLALSSESKSAYCGKLVRAPSLAQKATCEEIITDLHERVTELESLNKNRYNPAMYWVSPTIESSQIPTLGLTLT